MMDNIAIRRRDPDSPELSNETIAEPAPMLDLKKMSTIEAMPWLQRTLHRFEHFTWAWYTLTMSTGGLALLLSTQIQPYTFHGLQTIGKVVYIWDIVAFLSITSIISYRFTRYRGTLSSSITHPTEGIFVPTVLMSLSSLIAAIANYGIPSCGPWLAVAFRVIFWIYYTVSFISGIGHYYLLFTNPLLKVSDMTPAWDLPIFPIMLSGTIAATGAHTQPPSQAVPMTVAGLTGQGLGMLVSIAMYAIYIQRMIQYGLPNPNTRPTMFIAVGPPSFTALAMIGLATEFPIRYRNYFGASDATTQMLRVLATMSAIFIWSLAFWFFCLALLANLATRRQMSFHLNWYAFVFPNVGFTIATIHIGQQLQSAGIKAVGTAMTLCLIITYLCVGTAHIRAVWRRDILWEGKDENIWFKERKLKHEKLKGLKKEGV